jgi:hypothetical protein
VQKECVPDAVLVSPPTTAEYWPDAVLPVPPNNADAIPEATLVLVPDFEYCKSTALPPLAFPPVDVPSGDGPNINAPVPFGFNTKFELVKDDEDVI